MATKSPKSFESVFDAYSAVGTLGEGSAGRVFAVKNTEGKEFALKCLFPDRITSERRKRFKNEIDFCHKNKHPNIVQVSDFGLVDWKGVSCPFYVMPRFPTTLRAQLEEGIPRDLVLRLFSQMLDGLEAAHLLGVIHRDLKPENILCDAANNQVVVADFGIAHFEEDILATAVETKATSKMANLRYSAPEQRSRAVKVDHRADIYALGLMLNEMYTQEVPQGAGYKTIAVVAPTFGYLDSLVEMMIQQAVEARPPTIEFIKRQLVARQNEFIAFQQLDSKKNEVVPTTAPSEFEPIKIADADWKNDRLSLGLSRAPPSGWVERFRNPREGYESISRSAPHEFQFQGGKASVWAPDHVAQRVLDYAKKYVDMANRGYQRDLRAQAESEEEERRQKLAKEVAEAEVRARVLKNLKV